MSSEQAFVVRAESGYLTVPIVAIPVITIGAFTYFRDHLPEFCLQNAEKVIAIAALLTLVLAMVAWFRKSRNVAYASGQLRYQSWLTKKAIAVSHISNITFETELSGSGDQTVTEHYLSLWSGNDVLLRFNSQLWPQKGLAAIVRAIQREHPAVRTDHAVDKYIKHLQ
jgi:hypothetical protein